MFNLCRNFLCLDFIRTIRVYKELNLSFSIKAKLGIIFSKLLALVQFHHEIIKVFLSFTFNNSPDRFSIFHLTMNDET